MEGNNNKSVWIWIAIIILIVLVWWAVASRPAVELDTVLDDAETAAITEDDVDAVDTALEELEGLDDASLDAEFEDIDSDLDEL